MKNFTYLLTVLSAFVAFAFVSCEKDTTDNDKPDPIESFLSVEADTVFFTGDAAENRIVAVKAIDNSWVAACQDDASWCKVNTSKNSLGEKEIKISVDKNEDTLARECTVEVTLDALSEKFVVKQLGTQSDEATKIVIEKTEYETDFQAGELSVTVVANGTFTASTDADWVKYKEQTASEDGTVKAIFEIAANENSEPRSAALTISSRWTSVQATLTQKGYKPLHVSATEIKAGFNKDTVSVEISAVTGYTISIEEGKSWITRVDEEREDDIVRFAVAANGYKIDRTAKITVRAGSASEIITVTQIGAKEFEDLNDDGMADDIRIPVISATVSSSRSSANGADRLFDGSYTTFWATDASVSAPDCAWVEMNLDAEKGNTIDYMAITHTSRVGWGQFGQIEVYATGRDGVETRVAATNCGQTSVGRTKIEFNPALTDIAKVRIKILSSKINSSYSGSVQGSAAEIEFMQKNPENFDPLTIFTDLSCSELKAGIALADIEKIDNKFYRQIAEQIYMGLYNEFRVAEARPVPHPDVDAKLFRTNTMSLLDNVTGMYIPEAGKEHIILLDEDYGQTITISVIDWVNNEGLCQNKEADYAIGKGRNKITIRHKGLIYIKYHTDDYRNVKPVKVNFPTASVNGYFDLNKHKPEDFYDILKLASSTEQPHFDMVTSNCVLNYPKTHILSSTLLNSASNFGRAEELLKIYDTVFRIQEIVQGHDKYKAAGLQRGHRNKMLFSTTYGSTYGFSAAYRTGYNSKSMAYDVTNPTKLWNKTATSFNNNIVGSIWGLAHELGHSNQTTAFKWIGLTEVTNNLMCAITQTIFYGEGHTTLRYNDHFNKGMRDIATRMVTDRDGTVRRMTHCESVNTPSVGNVNGGVDPTTQLMPFWQLYMYYHLALGKTDFYPDFYELCRTCAEQPSTDAGQSQYMVDFMKRISDAAGEDLSDFCKAWGLPGVNNRMKVTHYGTRYITTTQEQIDEAAAYCSKYPKPRLNPFYINDTNIDMFRNPQPVSAGTHTYSAGGRYTMSGWSGVVAWKLVDPDTGATLCIHTNSATFTFAYQASVYMNNAAGTDYLYSSDSSYATSDSGTMRALKAADKVYYPNALVYGIAADGTEVASLSNTK